MPISALLRAMDPPVPADVLDAADDLRYRDFITVALVVPEAYGFPDNWIYINDSERQGRPHPELRSVVAVPGEGRPHLPRARALRERGRRVVDEVRRGAHRERQARARSRSGCSTRRRSKPGYVVRMPKAYPFYDARVQGRTSPSSPRGSASTRRTCIRSAATACTGTTTRTTRCSPRCSRSRTSSARTTTSGRSTSKRSTTRSAATMRVGPADAGPSLIACQRGAQCTTDVDGERDLRRPFRSIVAAIVVLPAPSGTASPVVPTQWIAKQYSELLGRTPTDARVGEVGAVVRRVRRAARRMRSPRWAGAWRGHAAFADDVPEGFDARPRQRFTALIRAALSRDPDAEDWQATSSSRTGTVATPGSTSSTRCTGRHTSPRRRRRRVQPAGTRLRVRHRTRCRAAARSPRLRRCSAHRVPKPSSKPRSTASPRPAGGTGRARSWVKSCASAAPRAGTSSSSSRAG